MSKFETLSFIFFGIELGRKNLKRGGGLHDVYRIHFGIIYHLLAILFVP